MSTYPLQEGEQYTYGYNYWRVHQPNQINLTRQIKTCLFLPWMLHMHIAYACCHVVVQWILERYIQNNNKDDNIHK